MTLYLERFGGRLFEASCLPGQRRLHTHNEQARRRRAIVSALASGHAGHNGHYDAARRYRTDREARGACLMALVGT